MFSRIRMALRAAFDRRGVESEMEKEMAFHLHMETEQNIRRGMTPAAARRAAVLAFGGVDRVSEEVRDVRHISWLDDLTRDLKHAARGLRRSPGFTLSAIAALSLGIGANTAVFSVVHGVVLSRLPFADPERLVRVWEVHPAARVEQSTVSPGTFVDLRRQSRTLASVALFGERDMLFSEGAEPWESRAAAVSPVLFDLLGVRPLLGRGFASEDPRTAYAGPFKEIVISHALWQQHFGGDPGVIGRPLRMDYYWSYTIVGVMPPGFAFPPRVDVWTPLSYGPTVAPIERQFRYYGAVARLGEGVTLDQARQDVSVIGAQLQTAFPASNAGWTVQLAPLDRSIVGNTRPALLVLLGLAGCVLLIACGNVATLAVARATARRHEFAVRMALGAGKARLVRQWTTEAVLLATLGGAGGLLLGYWSNRLLLAVAPRDIPRLDEVTFGGAVVAFVVLATCIVALIVGVAPAFRTRDARPLDAMRTRTASGAAGGARSREWLVGAQVALTFVLTVAAALLLRSFAQLQRTDTGFRRQDVVAAELRVPGGRFGLRRPWFKRLEYYDRLVAELERLPGVRSVGGTSIVPLTREVGSGSMWRTDAPGASGSRPPTSAADQWKAAIQLVTPRYFETMGIPLVLGRRFESTDRFTEAQLTDTTDGPRPPGVAIINEAMRKRYWPNGNALGSTILVFDDKSFAAYRTVVGVVGNVRAESVDSAAVPTIFLPYGQNPGQSLSLVVRSSLSARELVGSVRNRIRSFDPAVTIASVRPLDDVFGSALSRPRFNTLLVGSFAVLALVIAAVGVFGIVGFLVARRAPELGIRVALGAGRTNVLWLVLSEGFKPVLLGVIVGSLGAVAVARAMRALLYGVVPLDAPSFAVSAILLVVASLIAAVVPARRALGVDPLKSLRSE